MRFKVSERYLNGATKEYYNAHQIINLKDTFPSTEPASTSIIEILNQWVYSNSCRGERVSEEKGYHKQDFYCDINLFNELKHA